MYRPRWFSIMMAFVYGYTAIVAAFDHSYLWEFVFAALCVADIYLLWRKTA